MSYADLATSQALSTSQQQAANTVFNFYSAGGGGANSSQEGSASATASAALGGGDANASTGLAGIHTKTIVICAAILVGVVGLVIVHHYIKKG